MKSFTFLKALNSPFKPFKLKWYIGKVAIGTPYFYPRKWVKATPERAKKAALDEIEKIKQYNERNAQNEGFKPRVIRPFEDYYKEYLKHTFAVPKKIGFDFVGLGWKTKWSDTDYRFESAPVWSFVFFKWQIAVTFIAPEQNHYWTAWLYYERNTDKTKSKSERIEQCKGEYPMVWSVYTKEGTEKVDYYTKILKEKGI
jgi:hypothetical protein